MKVIVGRYVPPLHPQIEHNFNRAFVSDPIDTTKGIIEKFLAFEQFLIAYPEWQGKVVLVQNCLLQSNLVNDDDVTSSSAETLASQINEYAITEFTSQDFIA